MTRSLQLPSQQLVELVTQAGAQGLPSRQLLDAAEALTKLTRDECSTRLTNLRKAGYLRVQGRGRASHWFGAGVQPPATKPPLTRAEMQRLQRQRDVASDKPVPWPVRYGPKGVPPGVPNSVWALGRLMAQPQASDDPQPTSKE